MFQRMSRREIVVFGDMEVGGGTVTDDFISDVALAKVFRFLGKKKSPIDLVLNGDTFDFLKCPAADGTYPLQVTEQISLGKLERALRAHSKVIDALKSFLNGKNKNLYFTFGNHDLDLAFPKVQQRIVEVLKSKRVHFGWSYEQFNVHVEHGQQYDKLNRTNGALVQIGDTTVLNLSYSSLGVLESFMRVKEGNPFLERIHSRKEMFKLVPSLLRTLRWCGARQLFRQLYYDITRDPFRKTPRWLWRELWRRWLHNDWEVPDIVKVARKESGASLFVLGHLHHVYFEESDKLIVLPDTWRDEYLLDMHSLTLFPKNKYYARIFIEGSKFKGWKLVHVPITRSVLRFEDVVKDQMKYLALAAHEEGYWPAKLKRTA